MMSHYISFLKDCFWPKTVTTSTGNVGFDYSLPIPLTRITSLVTASFNIPRLTSINVSHSWARVMPV